MRPAARSGGAFAISIAMLLLRGAAGTDPASALETRVNAAVIGQVVNGLTGKPVPDARVAASASPDWNEGVTTDAQGRFVLRALPRGSFIVRASIDRWAGQLTGSGSYGQQNWSSPPGTLEVADGQIARGIVVPFWPDGVITGRITDAAGEPMAGAVVNEMRRSAGTGWRERDNFGRAATDDRGLYRLVHAPGSFLLAVTSTEMRARSIDGDPAGLQPFAFPTTFLPGVTNPAHARSLSIQPGEERTNIDFQLNAVSAFRVGGLVVSNGAPASGASVRLESIGSVDGMPVPEPTALVTDAAGRFSFPAVLPGDYVLSARSGRGCNSDDGEESLPVRLSVTTEDLADVRLTMSACPLLTGEVRFQGARHPTQEEINRVWIGVSPLGSLTPAGRFSGRLPPGRQELEVVTPAAWTVRSITVDDSDVTDRPIDVPPGTTHHAVVVLRDSPSSVRCVVAPGPGAVSPPAEAYLFPVDESQRRDGLRPARRVRVERVCDGSLCFDDVPPGEYFVIAAHGLESGDWPAAVTMDRLQRRARRIVVGDGENLQLRLEVVDASRLPESSAAFADERRLTAANLPHVAHGRTSTPQPAPPDPVIRGRVLIAGSDAPLAGTTVTLVRKEAPILTMIVRSPADRWDVFWDHGDPVPFVTTISDELGRFGFHDVPSGVYSLVAARPPFAPGALGVGQFPGPAMPLVVRAGERLQDLDIRMYAGATIGGSITDVNAAAVGRASVALYRLSWTVAGPVVRGAPWMVTDADDRGRYRFWGLPAGEYALEASAPAAGDYFPVTKAAEFVDPFKNVAPSTILNPVFRLMNSRYGPTRYPAGVSLGGDPTFGVILAAGEERTVDLRMAPGSPPMEWAPTGESGPYPDVAGRVVFATGSAPPSDLSAIFVVIKPLDCLEITQTWRVSPVDSSGRFRIKKPFGERNQWAVVTSPPEQEDAGRARRGRWIVTSVLVNGRESLDSGTHIVDDGGVEGVVVTLSDRPASVVGTVAGSAGPGSGVPDGTYVVLYPADAASRQPQSPRVRAVRPDSDRHFTFEDLVPGVYLVATLADVPEGAWWDPAVLDRLAASAVRIAVGPGARVVLQVR